MKTKSLRLALIGAETLLGRDLQDVIDERKSPVLLTAYGANAEGSFGEQEGEAIYVEPLTTGSIEASDVLVLAGNLEGAQRAYALVKESDEPTVVIDCVGYLEGEPGAKVVSPLLAPVHAEWPSLLTIAHPAAAALAIVLSRLSRKAAIQQAVANVFEPASERGKRGINELHQQTTGLLSFKTLDKEVFDTQLSFNMLAQYGEQAPLKLASVERRIADHLAQLLKDSVGSGAVAMPSLRVLAAPVFHGYSISLWVRFEKALPEAEIGEALASAQIEVRSAGDEAPTAVGNASQSGVSVGDIRVDPQEANAVWLWVVADNLRLTADAVADILLESGESA